jgi:transposase
VRPKQGCRKLYFALRPDKANVHAAEVTDFLRPLQVQLCGPLTVVWDGSNVHSRAKLVRQYLAAPPEIRTETLPAYAPELNPAELVWS